MIYEVRALRIKEADHFAESYEYRRLGYVNHENMLILRDATVPKINRWPQCHMEGWPLFEFYLVIPTETPESMIRNITAYLNDFGRERNEDDTCN